MRDFQLCATHSCGADLTSLSSSRLYRFVASALSVPPSLSFVGLRILDAIYRTISCSDGGESARRRELFATASHSRTSERNSIAACGEPVPHSSDLIADASCPGFSGSGGN